MNTTTTTPSVPLPPGADYLDDWEGDGSEMPYRFTSTTHTPFLDDYVNVWTSVVQYADGTIDDGRIQAPSVFISDWPIPNEKVRELILVLQKSLALVEEWTRLSDSEGMIAP
jgi:hypothetical protein